MLRVAGDGSLWAATDTGIAAVEQFLARMEQPGLNELVVFDLPLEDRDELLALTEMSVATLGRIGDQMRRLKTIDRSKLTGMDAVNYDTVLYVAETTQPILDLDIGGRDGFSPSCYVLSPITGAYQRMPNFLDENHRVETASDAEAYLARLDGFATALDANTDRFRHDAGQGVVPPDFLLDITIGQLAALRTTGDKSDLTLSLDRRARKAGLGEAYGPRAAQIYDGKVGPALDR